MSTAGPGDEQLLSGLDDPSVDATVLRMLLGSQLRRLREAAGITPEQAGYEIRASQDLPEVVYIEQFTGAIYLDQRLDVEHYLVVVDELSSEALTPAGTTRFIEQVARET
jgi:hypothetical protein